MRKSFILFIFILSLGFTGCKPVVNQNLVQVGSADDLFALLVEENALYEISCDFDLEGNTLTVPSGSTLRFICGSIKNGTVCFKNTYLDGRVNFIDCDFSGQIKNDEIELKWFKNSLEEENIQIEGLSYTFPVKPYDSEILENLFKCCGNKRVLVDRVYKITEPVSITNKITFEGYGKAEGLYALNYYNFKHGFYCPEGNSCFEVLAGADLSLYGVGFVGFPEIAWKYACYTSGNLWEVSNPWGASLDAPFATCAVDIQKGGRVSKVYDSSFNAFTYGMRVQEGGTFVYAKNTYFSSCRYGFWADGLKDFTLMGCRFNTNLVDFSFYAKSPYDNNKGIEEDEGYLLRKTGGGVYLRNCSNGRIEASRFEFNNIHLIIDECGKDLVIENNILDTASACQVLFYNANNSANVIKNSFSASNPAMNNIVFNGNTMARGARRNYTNDENVYTSHPGFSIFHMTEGNNRGSNITLSNNIVSDEMEMVNPNQVVYEDHVFTIHNTSTAGTSLICKGNNFLSCKAKDVFYAVDNSFGTYKIFADTNSYGTKTLKAGKASVLMIEE